MSEEDQISTVVIVDDEEMVLTSLSAFLSLETEYRVVTFTRAADALNYIQQHRSTWSCRITSCPRWTESPF